MKCFYGASSPLGYKTNHYCNEASFLVAQKGTGFQSGKLTSNYFNFLTSVFKPSMKERGELHVREM